MSHPMESSFERLLAKLVHDGIDIFTVMHGCRLGDFRDEIRHFDSGGMSISYLGPRGLIRLKLGTHREKDAVDVSALRQLLEGPDAFA